MLDFVRRNWLSICAVSLVVGAAALGADCLLAADEGITYDIATEITGMGSKASGIVQAAMKIAIGIFVVIFGWHIGKRLLRG
ncbi:MAG: hypothetical protein ACRC46_15350 [Thermoguttaceae bacterium]